METLTRRQARRLALLRAGLLKPEWTGLPRRASGRGERARRAAGRIIRRFGYLQLDTVSIAGARSHAIVLMSRLEGFDPSVAEELLQPGRPLFEYWGHEASWLPMELYPWFEFRRREFRRHPWWGDLFKQYPKVVRDLRRRIRDEGPLRSLEMEGRGSSGWWDLKVAKRVAGGMWSSGELAIRERRNFQRSYDLAERVIPDRWRQRTVPRSEAMQRLLLQALEGHGWATTGTLAQTWRLRNCRKAILSALQLLEREGRIAACSLVGEDGKRDAGWIRPEDLELLDRLDRTRPVRDRGVLLSPFDPLLWDRARVRKLFDFDQVLEIFKPAPQRRYGYYCLPVLAGERLVARYDLKAERKAGKLRVLSLLHEDSDPRHRQAATVALQRYARALDLDVET